MYEPTEQRFLDEINKMSQEGLTRYQQLVAAELVNRVLRGLTIQELKWLWKQIQQKRSTTDSVRGVNSGGTGSPPSGSTSGLPEILIDP